MIEANSLRDGRLKVHAAANFNVESLDMVMISFRLQKRGYYLLGLAGGG
jgi:hypothetical protein